MLDTQLESDLVLRLSSDVLERESQYCSSTLEADVRLLAGLEETISLGCSEPVWGWTVALVMVSYSQRDLQVESRSYAELEKVLHP